MKYLLAMTIVFLITGCSYKGVYEGIQMGKKNQCYKLPKSQQDQCIEEASVSYEEYLHKKDEHYP